MKLAVSDIAALASGSVVKHFAVVECLGIDQHVGLYRAASTETEHPVLLMEYLPGGLVERRGGVICPAPGEATRYQRALTGFATRLREVALVGHPALPELDDIWQEQGALYGVGPWSESRSLLADLALRRTVPDERLLSRWARTLCDALSTLHRHQLLHGNLAVHMLRLRQTGELMLPLIAGDAFLGDAPPWMAPEQHPLNTKPGPVGPWSDVYQLSAVMYQLMTGAAPPSVLQRWQGAPLERAADGQVALPAGLVAATRKGLAMHHDARPPSIEAWLEIAGLPDRRTRARYEPEPAESLQPPRVRTDGVRAGALAFAMSGDSKSTGRGSRHSSAFDHGLALDHFAKDTPWWVWLCLAVAVAAFISILARTI